MFDFEKLEVYKKAQGFNRGIRKDILKRETMDHSTRNQLNRAAISIMLNIAEGAGRFTKPDKRNFFVIARGSVFECVAVLDLLLDESVIDETVYLDFYTMAEELSKMLYSMIRKLEQ
jgi:four helix bundle protein